MISVVEILVLPVGEPPQWDCVGHAINITCSLSLLLYLMITVTCVLHSGPIFRRLQWFYELITGHEHGPWNQKD